MLSWAWEVCSIWFLFIHQPVEVVLFRPAEMLTCGMPWFRSPVSTALWMPSTPCVSLCALCFQGGFVRWALVPVSRMNNPVAHEHFAFRWGCWSAGRFVCSEENRRKLCLDDRLDEKWAQAFSEHVEVPKVVPDGDYVLSFVRWGGEIWWSW